MRFPCSPWRRPMALSAHMAVRFRSMMDVPLRWPRLTTQRLMIVVAIVAVLIWAGLRVPPMLELANLYRQNAVNQAALGDGFKVKERAGLATAMALQSDFDRLRRDSGRIGHLTERYFEQQIDFHNADAKYSNDMFAYHEILRAKYARAAWLPWAAVPQDPSPPSDPLATSSFKHVPGKIYERIMDGGALSVAFSPDGTTLALGCRDKTVKILEPLSGKSVASFPLPEKYPTFVAFSPDGTTLVAFGEGNILRRWDVATGQVGRELPWVGRSADPPDTWAMVGAAFSPDGKTIAIAAGGQRGSPTTSWHAIRLFDAETGVQKWEHKAIGNGASIAFSPDGKTLACVADGAAKLLDSRTGQWKTTLKPVAGSVLAVAFSPDGRTLAGGGSDTVLTGGFDGNGRVTLWEVASGAILRTLEAPTGRIQTVAFSPDGTAIASGGRGPLRGGRDHYSGTRSRISPSELRLWDVSTGGMIWTAEYESGWATSLIFSPDGRSLGFCDADYVYMIDAENGKLRRILMETTQKTLVRDRPPTKPKGAAGNL